MRFAFVLILAFAAPIAAQSALPIPKEIRAAYADGTRSRDGEPGAKYWQNAADYRVAVEWFPETRVLQGEETILYANNSPDKLNALTLKLFQNIYQRGGVRDFAVDPDDLHDGVEISRLAVDGEEIDLDEALDIDGTVADLDLSEPLQSGDTATIECEWSFRLPYHRNIRMGTYHERTAFVAYFFPRVAVYDDVNGWDRAPYTGRTEFYNDFGDFEVEITAPEGVVVWATGELQNPDEVLRPEIAERYRRSRESDEIVRIIGEEEIEEGATAPNEKNVWKFTAENVTDFAFGASDFYYWEASSVVVDSATDERVAVSAAFNPESSDFRDVVDYMRRTVAMFSFDFPGVKFPFPEITIYNGGRGANGMEYPMMVNNASVSNPATTILLVVHEIGHSYLPFMVGSDETRHAWMDEGGTNLIMLEVCNRLGEGSVPFDYYASQAVNYNDHGGTLEDAPVAVLSNLLEGRSYWVNSYYRSTLAYLTLRDMLGVERFETCYRTFLERWRGKHPTPYDLFATFEDVSGEELDWFWRPWFYEFAHADLAIAKARRTEKGAVVTVENRGGLPTAIVLTGQTDGERTYEKRLTAAAWKDGATRIDVEIEADEPITRVALGESWIPDVKTSNNAATVR
ncbi:MAG: hypothetical protein GF419_10945 [Ignavibacteriales bacterium]|nr:hypothetical protein [Ignavibacteriales bacterium]